MNFFEQDDTSYHYMKYTLTKIKEVIKIIFYVELVILFGWWVKLILITEWQDWS